MKNTIEIINGGKSFRKNEVFSNVNIKIKKGSAVGVVGHNGSGKSVLFKVICGFIPLTYGEVFVDGKKLGEEIDIPRNVGIIIETPGFLPYLTGFQNLHQLATIRGVIGKERIKEVMGLVGLDAESTIKVSGYSLGMRQRLAIAQAIMEKPDILILDEPFNGLDKEGLTSIRNLILDIKRKGVTILLASHHPLDIELICDEIYRFEGGKLEFINSINEY